MFWNLNIGVLQFCSDDEILHCDVINIVSISLAIANFTLHFSFPMILLGSALVVVSSCFNFNLCTLLRVTCLTIYAFRIERLDFVCSPSVM